MWCGFCLQKVPTVHEWWELATMYTEQKGGVRAPVSREVRLGQSVTINSGYRVHLGDGLEGQSGDVSERESPPSPPSLSLPFPLPRVSPSPSLLLLLAAPPWPTSCSTRSILRGVCSGQPRVCQWCTASRAPFPHSLGWGPAGPLVLSSSLSLAVVLYLVGRGDLPVDPRGYYAVLTSGDITVGSPQAGFCKAYCGFHSWVLTPQKERLFYGFVGDSTTQCSKGCGGNLGKRYALLAPLARGTPLVHPWQQRRTPARRHTPGKRHSPGRRGTPLAGGTLQAIGAPLAVEGRRSSGRRQRTWLPGCRMTANGYYRADSMVDTFAHELIETATNPDVSSGWWALDEDGVGQHETADLCSSVYVDDSNPQVLSNRILSYKYNLQGPNGFRYLVQTVVDGRTQTCALSARTAERGMQRMGDRRVVSRLTFPGMAFQHLLLTLGLLLFLR